MKLKYLSRFSDSCLCVHSIRVMKPSHLHPIDMDDTMNRLASRCSEFGLKLMHEASVFGTVKSYSPIYLIVAPCIFVESLQFISQRMHI